jgi:hypothetical protein
VVVACAAAVSVAGIVTSTAVGPVWALLLLSTLWLPANNHHFEGPVLLTVSRNHGVTVSDLAGIAGFLLATWILVRRVARIPHSPQRLAPALVLGYCCAAFALGAAGAWAGG